MVIEKKLLEDNISDLVVSLVHHTYHFNDEQDGILADKYSVCKCCYVTVSKLQNAFTEVSAFVRAKPTHVAAEESQTLEEKRASRKWRMSSHPTRVQKLRLMLLLLPWQHPNMISSNCWCPSKVFPRRITCLHPTLFLLFHPKRTLQGETYVRGNGTIFLLAANGESFVQICTQMSPMHSKWISSDAQAEASAFPGGRTLWVHGHWHFRTSTEEHDWISTCSYANGRFSKLTGAMLAAKISRQRGTIFLNNYVISYGIPSYLYTNNWSQFVTSCLATVCLFFRLKKLTTTACHPQANRPAELYTRTIASRLHHYVS